MKEKPKTINSAAQKHITEFEFYTLIGALRYYEYRSTALSATYTLDVLRRYFTGQYDRESCERIAHQYVVTDHWRGEEDWTRDGMHLWDCDKFAWTSFYAYLKAYLEGFSTLKIQGQPIKSFFCVTTGKWHPADKYVFHGHNVYIEPHPEEKEK